MRADEQSACPEEPAPSSTQHNLLVSEREVPLALTPASCATVYGSPQKTQESPCFAKATNDRAVGKLTRRREVAHGLRWGYAEWKQSDLAWLMFSRLGQYSREVTEVQRT
jgi:hypothetical protein